MGIRILRRWKKFYPASERQEGGALTFYQMEEIIGGKMAAGVKYSVNFLSTPEGTEFTVTEIG